MSHLQRADWEGPLPLPPLRPTAARRGGARRAGGAAGPALQVRADREIKPRSILWIGLSVCGIGWAVGCRRPLRELAYDMGHNPIWYLGEWWVLHQYD